MIYKTILRTSAAAAVLLGAGLFISPPSVYADTDRHFSSSGEQSVVTDRLR